MLTVRIYALDIDFLFHIPFVCKIALSHFCSIPYPFTINYTTSLASISFCLNRLLNQNLETL